MVSVPATTAFLLTLDSCYLLHRFRVSSRNVQKDLELRIRLHQLLFTPGESFQYDDTHRLNNAKRARLRHNNQTWPDSFKSSEQSKQRNGHE